MASQKGNSICRSIWFSPLSPPPKTSSQPELEVCRNLVSLRLFLSYRYEIRETNFKIPCLAPFIPFSIMAGPTASLNPLTRTDGSASYQCPSTGFNILSSVNGPIELPGRRDALKPEDATIEVFVKPGTAPSGVGEQYAKEIIKNMVGKLVLGRERGFPRRGVVITLAVMGGDGVARGDSVSCFFRNSYDRGLRSINWI